MKLTKEMQRALEDTVWAYERAIHDLEGGVLLKTVVARWDGYALAMNCRLCQAAKGECGWSIDCAVCPLNGPSAGGAPCQDSTMWQLENALRNNKLSHLTRIYLTEAFKIRLAWIHKRIGENGWEVS